MFHKQAEVNGNKKDGYSVEDRIDIIYMKNQLINAPLEALKEKNSGYKEFGMFLDALTITLDAEPAFFLIDDSLLRRAEEVIAYRRFEYRDPAYNSLINQIIGQINDLRNVPEDIKIRQKEAYIKWQHDVRQLGYLPMTDFVDILANDALLIQKLLEGDIGEMDSLEFFASTNYLTLVVPEFYHEFPETRDLTFKLLDKYTNKRGFWNWAERSYAKEVRNNLQKVKVKEE